MCYVVWCQQDERDWPIWTHFPRHKQWASNGLPRSDYSCPEKLQDQLGYSKKVKERPTELLSGEEEVPILTIHEALCLQNFPTVFHHQNLGSTCIESEVGRIGAIQDGPELGTHGSLL
jgi:hypothetical protein